MKFGALANTSISDWALAVDVENLGYDSIWFGDSQMIWSDVYATMALAAHNTSRIRLGSGVSIAGPRIPPVAANAIATINQLAPGRVQMAIELKGLDADVLALSRLLAVRTLQLEMEHVYRSLEDEALDMTGYDRGVGDQGEPESHFYIAPAPHQQG